MPLLDFPSQKGPQGLGVITRWNNLQTHPCLVLWQAYFEFLFSKQLLYLTTATHQVPRHRLTHIQLINSDLNYTLVYFKKHTHIFKE